MPRKPDTKQVDAVARAAAMSRGQRLAFGARLEEAKARGGGGTKNARGDHTMGELRAEAQAVPLPAGSGGQAVARSASHAEAERNLIRLVGATLVGTAFGLGDELELRFGRDVRDRRAATPGDDPRWRLRLASAAWTLTCDDERVACAGDDRDHVLQRLERLAGSELSEARLRRRDAALELHWHGDPFGAAFSLVVPGRRGRSNARWQLATPSGLIVEAHGDGTIGVGPDDGGSRG